MSDELSFWMDNNDKKYSSSSSDVGESQDVKKKIEMLSPKMKNEVEYISDDETQFISMPKNYNKNNNKDNDKNIDIINVSDETVSSSVDNDIPHTKDDSQDETSDINAKLILNKTVQNIKELLNLRRELMKSIKQDSCDVPYIVDADDDGETTYLYFCDTENNFEHKASIKKPCLLIDLFIDLPKKYHTYMIKYELGEIDPAEVYTSFFKNNDVLYLVPPKEETNIEDGMRITFALPDGEKKKLICSLSMPLREIARNLGVENVEFYFDGYKLDMKKTLADIDDIEEEEQIDVKYTK